MSPVASRTSPGARATGIPDLVVCGGGAAGLVCALAAARRGRRVVLLEKTDRCGAKLALAGGGRGNFTHLESPGEMVRHYDPGPRSLLRLIERVPADRVRSFFAELGVESLVDDERCVWPVSDAAQTLVDVLERAVHTAGVEVHTRSPVKGLMPGPTGWQVSSPGRTLGAGRVALCLGGSSYPGTGSSGDGYELARRLGHTIVPPFPALVALRHNESDLRALAGVSVPDVAVQVVVDGKLAVQTRGPLLLGHGVLSGRSVLDASGFVARARQEKKMAMLVLDWLPGIDDPGLLARLRAAHDRGGAHLVLGWLARFVPRRLAQMLLRRAGVPLQRRLAELTRDETTHLRSTLKRFGLKLSGTEQPELAMVTGGGVPLEEIDLRTCQSRRQPGLYVAGELLEVWGMSGGYNLHFAWATGITVGESV